MSANLDKYVNEPKPIGLAGLACSHLDKCAKELGYALSYCEILGKMIPQMEFSEAVDVYKMLKNPFADYAAKILFHLNKLGKSSAESKFFAELVRETPPPVRRLYRQLLKAESLELSKKPAKPRGGLFVFLTNYLVFTRVE